MGKNINFSSLNFSDVEQSKISRELVDHLFMLKEQLEYTLSNLGTDNFNQKELKVFADSIRVTGAVTFDDLESDEETLINGAYIKSGFIEAGTINGAYIKSGTIEASTIRTFTEELNQGVSVNGAVYMYYVFQNETWEEALDWNETKLGCSLLGGLELNDDGTYDDSDTSTRIRFCLYARNYKHIDGSVLRHCSLKLSSEYRASLEAEEGIFIYTSGGEITIRGDQINLVGEVYVNNSKIS